jgi:hypothetical protein
MPPTKNEIESQLEQSLREQEDKQKAIDETRELLKKADQRKKENPDERSRWSLTVANLEMALYSNKRALTVADNQVITLKRKLEAFENRFDTKEVTPNLAQEVPMQYETPLTHAPASSDSQTIQNRIDAVVQRALNTPLFKIKDIPQDEARLLRAFLDSPNSGKLSRAAHDDLKKRVSIIERSQSGAMTQPGGGETLLNNNIMTIIRKCANLQYSDLTIKDINVLKNYHQELLRKTDLTDNDKARLDGIEKANSEIRNILSRWLNF